MSHFCSMVIITPDNSMSLDECLEDYSEYKEVPEYVHHEVDEFERIEFLSYYGEIDGVFNKKELELEFVNLHKGENGYKTLEEVEDEYGKCDEERYAYFIIKDHHQEYADFFINKYPALFNDFANEYSIHGKNWNNNSWRINPDTGRWCDYSTYNPKSVYDYYTEGWGRSLKTKSGEYVNMCLLGEIDWTPLQPEDYCKTWKKDIWGKKYHPLKKNVKWHFNKKDVPYTVFINDKHLSRGKVVWFGMSNDELTEEEWQDKFFKAIKDLPSNSECYLLDMHI